MDASNASKPTSGRKSLPARSNPSTYRSPRSRKRHTVSTLQVEDKPSENSELDDCTEELEAASKQIEVAREDPQFHEAVQNLERRFKDFDLSVKNALLYSLLKDSTTVQVRFFLKVLQDMANLGADQGNGAPKHRRHKLNVGDLRSQSTHLSPVQAQQSSTTENDDFQQFFKELSALAELYTYDSSSNHGASQKSSVENQNTEVSESELLERRRKERADRARIKQWNRRRGKRALERENAELGAGDHEDIVGT